MPDGSLFFDLSGICFMADKIFLRNLRKWVDNKPPIDKQK